MSKTIFTFDKNFARERIFKELENYSTKEQEKIKSGIGDRYQYDFKEDNENFPSLPVVMSLAKIFKKPAEFFLYEESVFVDILKENFISISYIAPHTDEENNFIYLNRKHMCYIRYESLLNVTEEPLKTVVLPVNSDTMEDTLRKDDELLIDISQKGKNIEDGGIYIFNTFGFKSIRIRRFFLQVDNLKLIADNKDKYDPCIATLKDINILGRVLVAKHFFCKKTLP